MDKPDVILELIRTYRDKHECADRSECRECAALDAALAANYPARRKLELAVIEAALEESSNHCDGDGDACWCWLCDAVREYRALDAATPKAEQEKC